MDRTQKKCVVASTGLHVLLAFILLFGPAFVSSRSLTEDPPLLDFVPIKTVDDLMSGGGYKDGQLPTAAPVVQPQPQPVTPPAPQPEKQPDPEPPKTPAKPVDPPKDNSETLVPAKPVKRTPEVSTKLIVRNQDSSDSKAKAEQRAKAEAKAAAEARQRIINKLGQAADRIGEGVSGSTSIKLLGPGGGGIPYANFMQAVKTVYTDAWVVPDGVEDDKATTVASVTIARNGEVIDFKIISRSGNTLVDQSVLITLQRVKYAAPLPDNAKEDRRTVTINFNVKAKQGLG
jgi:TonB family protein